MRALSLILAVLMLFAFVACSDETVEQSDAASTAESKAESTPAEESTEASTDESTEASTEASTDESTEESTEASTDESTTVDESSEVVDESSEPEEETSEPEEEEYELPTYSDVEIGKADVAPVVDGNVDEDEYVTVIDFDMDETYWNYNSDEAAKGYKVSLNMAWDEEYLYVAVKLRVGKPRTYDNANFTSTPPYIFHRRHVMTAIVTGDPTSAKYLEPNGDPYWDWSAAYGSGLASEWTISAQPDGSNIKADHFGAVTGGAGFEYCVGVSGLDYEVYEQKIPWAALAGGSSFVAEEGAIFGYAFSSCCEEIDYEDDEAESIYACFGGGIAFGKSFSEYVPVTLVK
ncbi:MAG: hypothetical protein IKU30_06425 [Clostridia bacterium]|nr:hypothetical protein [Clostridia bacterium]